MTDPVAGSSPSDASERLIDYVLGELPPDEAHAEAARVAHDPEAAAERDRVLLAISAIRDASAEGWTGLVESGQGGGVGGRAALRWLKPALVAAALLLAVLALFHRNGVQLHPDTVYEPDEAYGYLLPEEVDAAGAFPHDAMSSGAPSGTQSYVLRDGRITAGAIGADRRFDLAAGARIADGSRIETTADGGARIDLPGGGVLFMGPLTEIHLRRHQNGGAAVRLKGGVAAFVATHGPIHAAVDDTALLLRLDQGAALVRQAPGEALCLRGHLVQRTRGSKDFLIPAGERLPAACAKEPWTEPYRIGDLDLDWYQALVYVCWRSEAVTWTKANPGRSDPITAREHTMVFLRLLPREAGQLKLAFGGKPRTFALRKGVPLTLRLRLRDLGPGPVLTLNAPAAVREARLFEATPR